MNELYIHDKLLVTFMTALLVLDPQLVQLVHLVMDVEVCMHGCQDVSECDTITGHCTCQPGYTGTTCHDECPEGCHVTM